MQFFIFFVETAPDPQEEYSWFGLDKSGSKRSRFSKFQLSLLDRPIHFVSLVSVKSYFFIRILTSAFKHLFLIPREFFHKEPLFFHEKAFQVIFSVWETPGCIQLILYDVTFFDPDPVGCWIGKCWALEEFICVWYE